jgi:hypothetical protein
MQYALLICNAEGENPRQDPSLETAARIRAAGRGGAGVLGSVVER